MKIVALTTLLLFPLAGIAQQSIISQWNFNSKNPDGSLSTGSTDPSIGTGTLESCGGVELSFSTAGSNGGSSDNSPDNTGLNTTHYPAQGKNNSTGGIVFSCDLLEYKDIQLSVDARLTSTASKNILLSFSVDTGKTWNSVSTLVFTGAANSWQNSNQFDLRSFTELNDHPNALFKLVTIVDPTIQKYVPVGANSSYSTSGSIRYDQLIISGEESELFKDVTPPEVLSVTPVNTHKISILVNEWIDATSIDKSRFSGMAGLDSVAFSTDSSSEKIELIFNKQFPQGQHHTLHISGLLDTAGNELIPVDFPVFLNASHPDLIISEIMYNNPGDDDLEFIELYNRGNEPALLEQFTLTGITHLFSEPLSIAPDRYLLLAKDANLSSAELGASFLEWNSGSLNNTGECIAILNQLGDTIEKLCYDNSKPWPQQANGLGSSLELISPKMDHSSPLSWRNGFVRAGHYQGEEMHCTPGFGYGDNKVSFKANWFEEAEGLGVIKIPVIMKAGSIKEPVYIHVQVSDTSFGKSDFTIVNPVLQLVTGKTAYIEIEVTDDHELEEDETYTIAITGVCNGSSFGYESAEITIHDNDNMWPKVCIAEWMPQNSKKIPDDFGEYEPWIQLYNPNTFPVSLTDYSLRVSAKNSDSTTTHQLKSLSISAEGFQIFYCDSQPQQGKTHLNLHLPFKQGKIELIAPDSLTIVASRSYATSYSNKSSKAIEPCEDSIITNSNPNPVKEFTFTSISNQDTTSESNCKPILYNNKILHSCESNFWIYAMDGQLVKSGRSNGTIDLSEFHPGIYTIRLVAGNSYRFSVW